MKERQILFSGAMVRAILDGRKTQTRRVVKLPHNNPLGAWEPTTIGGKGLYRDKACTIPANEPERAAIWHTRTGDCVVALYGQPGDRLWVRETWREDSPDDAEAAIYRADGRTDLPPEFKWKPSIFMPRWASRITLEITGVRVERLQDIGWRDCAAEGTPNDPEHGIGYPTWQDAYAALWDSINAKRAPWASNPWVWVVEFKRVTQ